MTTSELKAHLVKVRKPVARKAYNRGLPVFLIVKGYNLHSDWVIPARVTNADGQTFENCLNHFSYYNGGKEPWYYLVDEDYNAMMQ